MSDDLLDTLWNYVNSGDDACPKGTPMIPLHRDTMRAICERIEALTPPRAICGYPITGWRLDSVHWDEREGQPDGWIASLKRESADGRIHRGSVCVMARSDVGPLEAWDEAIRIARREDAREAEREAWCQAKEARDAA